MQDIQKKVYHKNRFFISPKTMRFNPQEGSFKEVFNILNSKFNILESYVELNNLVIYINKNEILEVLTHLKDSSFDILTEMSAIHLQDNSFDVFYQLLSMEKILRIRVKTNTKDNIDSVNQIYRNAIWSEREAFDMFGIKFLNHPCLKRLIMPDDWSGYPLRKDYPLLGDEKAQWYEVDKIFGEDYREVVGPEQRDPAFINPKDTFNFAHMGFEVSKGTPPDNIPKEITYQEKGGVFVVTKFDKQKQLQKRR